MQSKTRKLRMKLYGHLYKRVTGFDWEKCAYCGEPALSFDHVPPISLVENMNIEIFKTGGGKFELYPSCLKCNRLLFTYDSTYYPDRLRLLIDKYEKKRIKTPHWDESEIKTLGYTLRELVKNSVSKYEILSNKLHVLYHNLINYDYEG